MSTPLFDIQSTDLAMALEAVFTKIEDKRWTVVDPVHFKVELECIRLCSVTIYGKVTSRIPVITNQMVVTSKESDIKRFGISMKDADRLISTLKKLPECCVVHCEQEGEQLVLRMGKTTNKIKMQDAEVMYGWPDYEWDIGQFHTTLGYIEMARNELAVLKKRGPDNKAIVEMLSVQIKGDEAILCATNREFAIVREGTVRGVDPNKKYEFAIDAGAINEVLKRTKDGSLFEILLLERKTTRTKRDAKDLVLVFRDSDTMLSVQCRELELRAEGLRDLGWNMYKVCSLKDIEKAVRQCEPYLNADTKKRKMKLIMTADDMKAFANAGNGAWCEIIVPVKLDCSSTLDKRYTVELAHKYMKTAVQICYDMHIKDIAIGIDNNDWGNVIISDMNNPETKLYIACCGGLDTENL